MNKNDYQYSSYHNATASSSSDGQNDISRLSQVIGTNTQKISQNANSLQRMVNQLGTPQDSESLRNQLHSLQNYTNQLAKDTSAHLKDLNHLLQSPNVPDQKHKKMLSERLMNAFSEALKNFQTVQRTAAQKEKESVMRARANTGLRGTPFDDDNQMGHTNLIDLSSPGQSQISLQMEEEVNNELLLEREEAIRKLESDISDVNTIFKDLATMVHEQGEMIDSIEANVESAVVHVSEGTQQLQKAREHQAKARKKMCCLIVLGIVILATIIIIIVVTQQ